MGRKIIPANRYEWVWSGDDFSCTVDNIYNTRLPAVTVRQSMLYELLGNITRHNEIYKQAGAVHGCALCKDTEILTFVEDVGRHNAADAIAGEMWLEGTQGGDKIFYTTGRLTSEMVMKAAEMGIPFSFHEAASPKWVWNLPALLA